MVSAFSRRGTTFRNPRPSGAFPTAVSAEGLGAESVLETLATILETDHDA
jgi:hypothetical protein